jgi:hypothetical protein
MKVIACIGTVGYPTFEKCYQHTLDIKKKEPLLKDIVIIKNKYPTSAWLNEMIQQSMKYDWCLQVDEDMYLDANIISKLLGNVKNNNVLNSSALLFDLFLKTKIGSVKLWNTKAFNHVSFKNVKGSDRLIAKEAESFGYYNVSIPNVLGKHDSAPSVEIAYFKYKEYIIKIKKYDNIKAAEKSLSYIKNIYLKNKDKISYAAFLGAQEGLLSDSTTTKNYIENMNSDECKKMLLILKNKFKE